MSGSTTTSADGAAARQEPWREPWLRELLRCPLDRAELRDADLGGAAVLACTDPGHAAAYPVLDGVPVLLADDAVPFPATAPPAAQEA